VVDRLRERYSADPRYPALIVGGSIVKGRARDDSDVDVLFIATDEEWERQNRRGELFLYSEEMCDYPGGYMDGKLLTYRFLEEVADRGSEPARSAFIGASPFRRRSPASCGTANGTGARDARRWKTGKGYSEGVTMKTAIQTTISVS
jgi:hypothetical protein